MLLQDALVHQVLGGISKVPQRVAAVAIVPNVFP